jgi:hypothetical protein
MGYMHDYRQESATVRHSLSDHIDGTVVRLKRILLRLIVAVILIAFLFYRSRPRTHFTPDAQREIERGKRR